MTHGLAAKVALVTGAASGIGLACAARLSQDGAKVFLADINRQEGAKAAADITARGGAAEFLVLDVSQETDWIGAIEQIKESAGGLDILLNNAGIALQAPLTQMALKDFQRQNAINVDGVFLGMKHAIPVMRDRGGGSIINMSSVSGLKGIPQMSGYSASKGAVRLMTKAAALECAGENIRVNSVHPGMIDTPIYDHLVNQSGEARSAAVSAWATDVVPMGIKGTPDDVADAVLWLASERSRYVTGAEIVIDGGVALR